MKNRLVSYTAMILLFTPALAVGQNLSDYCHVYLINMQVAKKAAQKYPTGDDQEDAKLLASAITIVADFPQRWVKSN